MRGAQPKNKTEKEKENLISNEKNCAMASAVLAGKDRKRILLAKFLSPISAKEQKNCFVRAHQLLFFWRRLQGMRCFQRGADFFSSCYNSFRDHGFFDTFFWRAWGGGHGGASSLSASDSTTINTTDTRDRQHDDDFEKGLDCGDHLSVLDPPFDGAAGCLRVWRVQRRGGRRLIFQPLDHQWARLLPHCRERWLCKAVI